MAAIDKGSRVKPKSRGLWSWEWLIPAGLLLLIVIPAVSGTFRLAELGSGAEVTAKNARFFAAPAPVIIHIISSLVYSVLGAFQFVPSFRLRKPRWHRRAGLLLVPMGIASALSGLWMSHFYDLPDMDGQLLYVIRLVVGSSMTIFICLGYLAFRKRRFAQHGAWMIRAYALGLGASTQVLTHIPWFILADTEPSQFPRTIMMGAGWVINLMLAEWVIYKGLARPHRKTRPAISSQPMQSS